VVLHGKPVVEPHNLGRGWVGFAFDKAFRKPVRIVNDAALQAIGSYKGGRMLFLGLGTGLGCALIIDGVVEPTELAHLPYKRGRTYEEYVGERGRKRLGNKKWRGIVADVVARLSTALEVDETVIGGGNARRLTRLPRKARRVTNSTAFVGGVRLWQAPRR
jgi:polyphosphate glucokinase